MPLPGQSRLPLGNFPVDRWSLHWEWRQEPAESMEGIVLIPGLFALVYVFLRGATRTFLDVYIPVLFFLPEYYRWTHQGIPKMTFSQPVILVVIFYLFVVERRSWRWSWADLLVGGMVVVIAISEYTNAGYKEAQNLTFDMLTWYLFPYAAAKVIIEPKGMRVAVARRFVMVLFTVSLISIYEFRFAATPYRLLLDRFFPGQGLGWVTTFRWGFARIAGPYGHAILAGTIMVIAYRLQRWLEWTGNWESQFKKLPWLPVSKARAITLTLILGTVMTMVRGPWMAGVIGAIVAAIGCARNPRRAALLSLAAVVAIGIPAASMFYAYASVGRAAAKTVAQESAAYRKELIDKYLDIAIAQSALGYGRNTWPKILEMPSIDNYYLMLALMHGFVVVALFVASLVSAIVRLFRRGLVESRYGELRPSFGFTLAGCLVLIMVSIATVYLGTQLIPLTALVIGWSEGYLLTPLAVPQFQKSNMTAMPSLHRFARIVA